jgi:hypothetical protein
LYRNLRIAAVAGFLAAALGLPCRAEPTEFSFELARPLGDVYNERTTDGDAYPQSIGLRAGIVRGSYALTLDYRRNVYLTESGGPGVLTQYARIEGGFGTSVPFLARESAFEARLERRLGGSQLYAGAGVVRTWTNYHYPSLTGVGVGFDLRPGTTLGFRPFASAFYYPYASGSYVSESLPARTFSPAFQILKFDGGVVLRGARSPLYWVFGYGNETRSGRALPSDVRFIRSDPYAAAGLRI